MRKFVVLLFFMFFAAGAISAWSVVSFLSSPAQESAQEIIYEVPEGKAFAYISNELAAKGLIRNSHYFTLYARITNQATQVKIGEYKFNTTMTPNEVLDILTSGKSIAYNFTIPEGYNIFEIRDELNAQWPGRGDAFFKIVTDKNFVKKLTGMELKTLEGYLFPETYAITKFTETEDIVQQMYDNFKTNINKATENSQTQMSLHDHVTLASVIEKETGVPEERSLISSVFHNRLQKKMRLQSDPTIIYGIAERTGVMNKNIKKSDILTPTEYNTYTVKALPIGPIANPGLEALKAAVNPAQSNYYYFVSRNDGTHVFSESYKDHDRAVKKFQLDRKMREGKSWRDYKKSN